MSAIPTTAPTSNPSPTEASTADGGKAVLAKTLLKLARDALNRCDNAIAVEHCCRAVCLLYEHHLHHSSADSIYALEMLSEAYHRLGEHNNWRYYSEFCNRLKNSNQIQAKPRA